ncbi:hypothetical protein M9Y10_009151 [Tritrichomonas musculus]|uniref:HECT domain-containing protein n=1 Tax=Tritrichomonas musculus TaxID=1915356 RepID=A0ABR2J1Y4_9EUKA
MRPSILSFLSNGTPNYNIKVATEKEAKEVSDKARFFFTSDYNFPPTQTNTAINLFPSINTNNQVQYVATDVMEINFDSDSDQSESDFDSEKKEKLCSFLNTAFSTNSIYLFQKCLQHHAFTPVKKPSNEMKSCINSIVKTISSSDNFLGFYPEPNFSAKISIKYDKLASTTAFAVSQSQIFVGLIDGNSSNGQIDVYNINFTKKRLANDQDKNAPTQPTHILFPSNTKLKRHEHYSIVIVKNVLYQIFDSMVRIKPLDGYDTVQQKYEGVIEFKKHESFRYPAVTDGNKIYCFDKNKKVVNIFSCEFDLDYNSNDSDDDIKENLLLPKFEKSVSLSFPFLIIDTDNTVISTDGAVITFGCFNQLKKEAVNDDSSSNGEGNLVKYHFYTFSLINGKLLKKFSKKYDSIIDAWYFNPFKITHFTLTRSSLRFVTGIASIPRWIEGFSVPIVDKKTCQQVPEAFEIAVFEGSTFFTVGDLSAYQTAFNQLFEFGNVHLLKAFVNLFISYSPDVDDAIETLNNGYAKAVKLGISRLLFFTFLAVIQKARKDFDENNYASQFIEGNKNFEAIFIFPSLFTYKKLHLTNKAKNKVFLYSLEKENEFPNESLIIAKNFCNKFALNFMKEEDFAIIKESVEKVFYRVSQYIDVINTGKMQADSFKNTATFHCWAFFVNEITRHKSIWIYYADSFLNILNFSLSKSASDLSFQMNMSLILYLEILTSLPHQNQEGYFQDLDEFYASFENPLNGVDKELDSQLFELLNYAFNLTKKKFAECLFKCRQYIKFEKDSKRKVQDYIEKVGLLDYLIVENTKILLPIKTTKFSTEFFQLFSKNSNKLTKQQLIIFSFYSSQLGDLVFSISKENLPLIKDFSLFFDISKITKKIVQKHKVTFPITELLNVDGNSLESKYDVLIQLKDHISDKYMIFDKMKEETYDESKNINYLKLSQVSNQAHNHTLWVLFCLALQTNYLISAKKSSSSPYFQKNDDSSHHGNTNDKRKSTREKSQHNIMSNKKQEHDFNVEEYLDIFRSHIICGSPSIIRMIMRCITFANEIINKENSKMNPIFTFLLSLLIQYISEKKNPFILQSQPASTLESVFIIIQYMKEMFNEVNGQFRSFFLEKVKKVKNQEKAIPIFAILNNSIEVIRPNVEIHLMSESLEEIVGTVISHSQLEAKATIHKCKSKLSNNYVDVEVNLSKCSNIWCSCPTTVKLDDIEDLKPFVHLFFNVPIKSDKNDPSESYFANSFKFASLWEFIYTTDFYDWLNEEQINKIIHHQKSFPSAFYPELYLFDFSYYMSLRWMKFSPFSFVDVANSRNNISRSPVVNNLVLKQKFNDAGMMTTLFDSSTLVSPPIHPMNEMKIFIYLHPKEKQVIMFNKRKVHDIQLNVFGLALPFNCVLQSHDFNFDAFPDETKEIVIEFCPKIIAFKVYENGKLIKKTLGSPSIAMYFMTINLESNNVIEYRVEYTTKRTDESQINLSNAFGPEEANKDENQKENEVEIEEEEDPDSIESDDQNQDKDNLELYFDDNTDENFMSMTNKKVYTQMNDSCVFNEICLRDSASGLIDSFITLITIHHIKKTKSCFPFCALNLLASIDPYPTSKALSLEEIIPTPRFRDTSSYIFQFIKDYVKTHSEEIISNLYDEMKLKYLKDCNIENPSIENYEKTSKNLFCITNENRSALLVRKNQNVSISNCVIFSASSKKPLKIIGLFEDDVKMCFSHPGIIVPYLRPSGSIIDYLVHMRHIMSISISLKNYDFNVMKSMIDKLEQSGRYFAPLFHEFVEILNIFNPKVPKHYRFPVSLNPLSFLVNSSLVHEKPELFLLTTYCEHFGCKIPFAMSAVKKVKKIKYVRCEKSYKLYISIHDDDNPDSLHLHRLEFTLKSDPPVKIRTNTYTVIDSKILTHLTFECTSEKVEESNVTFVICKVPKIECITNDLKKWKPHHTHQLLTFLYWKSKSSSDKSKHKKRKKNKDKSKIKVRKKIKKGDNEYSLLKINEEKLLNQLVIDNYESIPLSTEFSFKTAKFVISLISKISSIIRSDEANHRINDENDENDKENKNKDDSDNDMFKVSDNSSENDIELPSMSSGKSVFVLKEGEDSQEESNDDEDNSSNNSKKSTVVNNSSNMTLFFYYFHVLEISMDIEKVDPILAPFEFFRRVCDHTFIGEERVNYLRKNELTFASPLDPDVIRVNIEFPLYRQYETEFHSRLRPNNLIKYIHDGNADNELLIKKLVKFLKKAPSIVLLLFVEFCTGLWGTGWLLGKSKSRPNNNSNENELKLDDIEIVNNYMNRFDNNYGKDEDEFDSSKNGIYVFFSKKQEVIESFQPGNLLILGSFSSSEKLTNAMLKKLQEFQDGQIKS